MASIDCSSASRFGDAANCSIADLRYERDRSIEDNERLSRTQRRNEQELRQDLRTAAVEATAEAT